MIKKISFLCLSLFTFGFLLPVLFTPTAEARIDIVPQKLVIENRERSADMTVLNLQDITGTFRIELVNFIQDENGVYSEIKTPLNPDFDPTENIRFSPRQFTLEPGGKQKVRISLRRPANLPEGEYRVHIKATRLVEDDERRSETSHNISVISNIGVTIPVIIRHGDTQADAKISAINLRKAPNTKTERAELDLTINRVGTESTIGMIEVLKKQEDSSQEKRIGYIKNMNVFTDIEKRNITIPLSEDLKGSGTLHVRYIDDIQKGRIFDETDMAF